MFVKPEHESRISHVNTASVKTGLGNTLGRLLIINEHKVETVSWLTPPNIYIHKTTATCTVLNWRIKTDSLRCYRKQGGRWGLLPIQRNVAWVCELSSDFWE